jgi:uncharacterized membrane protein
MVLILQTIRFRGLKLKRLILTSFAVLLLSAGVIASQAFAHQEHRKQQQLAEQQAAAAKQREAAATGEMTAEQMHESMGEMMMEPAKSRFQMSVAQRLLDWLGRFHPIIVHFPIAFFPAALFTAIVGRRRPAFSAPVQFLVVAGGIISPISALLGWFNGGWVAWDADPLLAIHRWLGTGIGVGGLLLGIWAWRRPWEDRGAGMILALAAMTIALAVQGWFGGALVHGAEHLNW